MIGKKDKSARSKTIKRLAGKSLQCLVNEAYRIIENPFILCNLRWEIIAYTEDAVTDDPIWNHHIQNDTIKDEVKDIALDLGMNETFMANKKLQLFHNENLKYDRIVAKLFSSQGIAMAFAILVASDRPFLDGDCLVFESICDKLAEEMRASGHYADHGQKSMELSINRLIDADTRNDIYYRNFIELVYAGLKNHLYVAAVDISQCNPSFSRINFYKNLFQLVRPAFKYSVYSKHVVIIMSTDQEEFYPKRIFHRLNKLFEKHKMRVGISRRFENLFDLRMHYCEAVRALKSGLRNDGDKLIYVYSDERDASV